MKQIVCFTVELRDLYMRYMECNYDIMRDYEVDPSIGNFPTTGHFEYFQTEAGLHKAFTDGNTSLLLPNVLMQKVDRLVQKNVPYVIAVMTEKKVYTYISHLETEY